MHLEVDWKTWAWDCLLSFSFLSFHFVVRIKVGSIHGYTMGYSRGSLNSMFDALFLLLLNS